MFRKHKGKFAAGSRNRYQSGNVPQTPQKKEKSLEVGAADYFAHSFGADRRHCHFRHHLSKQDSAGRP